MAISLSLQQYLDGRGVDYETLTHERTLRSSDTAEISAISEDNLAKGVLLRRKGGYLLAIVPASCHVRIDAVAEWMKQPVHMATEADVANVFDDCELGSVPPVAGAYGLPAVMDESLEGFSDIYFEGGDHRTLVHLSGRDFHNLTREVPHARIGARNH
jgi:Ala-tRNA(Pro) deacylase